MTPHLRRGEIIAGIGAAVLLVSLFALHWTVTGPAGHRAAHTGFGAFPVLRFFLLVAGVLGVLVIVLQATMRAPAGPASADTLASSFGALTVLLLVIRLLLGSGSVQVGAIVGLAGCAAVAVGAFVALRAEDGWTPGPDHPVELIRVGRAPGV